MCGIFGSPNIDDSVRAMLPFLGLAMQTRGRDAWGASDGTAVLKHTGELVDSWGEEWDKIQEWTAGIFHTRGASVGSAKILDNAHPFSFARADGDMVIGIHNGAITNHDELDGKYNRKCSVDSMHIWQHRAEGKSWEDLEGWGNLAWWEKNKHDQRVIHLTRFNSDNLSVAKLKGGQFIFASEIGCIRQTAKLFGNPVDTVYHIEQSRHYWFGPRESGEMELWKEEEVFPFPQTRTVTAVVPWEGMYSARNFTPSKTEPLDDYCAKCAVSKINGKKSLLCSGCFNELVNAYFAWKFPTHAAMSGHYPRVN